MQSNGGLAAADTFHAMSSVLSGPAGGLIGMQWIGNHLNNPAAGGFRHGRTSTDVSLLDGELPRRFRTHHRRRPAAKPDAGCAYDRRGWRIDPPLHRRPFRRRARSAGADPGPASYGRDGPLTLTDVQVLLGRLRTDTLPSVFGHEGDRVSTRRLWRGSSPALASQVTQMLRLLRSPFLDVAVRGHGKRHPPGIDAPRTRRGEFTLFCFGGALDNHDPVELRTPRVCGKCSYIRSPVCCRRSESVLLIVLRCGAPALRLRITAAALSAADDKLRELRNRHATSSPCSLPIVPRRPC